MQFTLNVSEYSWDIYATISFLSPRRKRTYALFFEEGLCVTGKRWRKNVRQSCWTDATAYSFVEENFFPPITSYTQFFCK